MTLLKTKNYIKNISSLSKKDKLFLTKQEKLLAENIFDSKLHTKKLKGLQSDTVYSFRVTRIYRGLFRTRGTDVILFAIGHRKDIYQDV